MVRPSPPSPMPPEGRRPVPRRGGGPLRGVRRGRGRPRDPRGRRSPPPFACRRPRPGQPPPGPTRSPLSLLNGRHWTPGRPVGGRAPPLVPGACCDPPTARGGGLWGRPTRWGLVRPVRPVESAHREMQLAQWFVLYGEMRRAEGVVSPPPSLPLLGSCPPPSATPRHLPTPGRGGGGWGRRWTGRPSGASSPPPLRGGAAAASPASSSSLCPGPPARDGTDPHPTPRGGGRDSVCGGGDGAGDQGAHPPPDWR